MPTITLSMPDDLKKQMDEFGDINWSEVARESIRERISQLAILNSIVKKSKLTKKDALEIGKKINASLHKRYKSILSKS